MDNILKGIVIATGVLLTIILVGIGFYIARETKNTSAGGLNQINKINEAGNQVELIMYDGMCISGLEVISMIKDYKEKPLYLCVKTKASVSLEGVYYNYDYVEGELKEAGTYIENMASNEDKINKVGKFICSLNKNNLNVIVGISFIQK